jgi:predicted lactoylglutathione lyase
MLDSRIHIIALGVEDIHSSAAFYRNALGLQPSAYEEDTQIIFFKTSGVTLELFKRPATAAAKKEPDMYGCVLSHNVQAKEDVDAILKKVAKTGGSILKPGTKTSWGGYHGYFCDIDNYCWVLTYWSQWQYHEDGSLHV